MPDIRSCLEELYLEVFPVEGIEEQLEQLPDGAYLGVTCSPKQGLQVTLDLVDSLQGRDFHLVPHVAARQVRDRAHLTDIVQQFRDQGVESIFVPGGDIVRPVGEYSDSLELLRDLVDVGHSFRHVGVAAYPEGWYWFGTGFLLLTLMFLFASIPMMEQRSLERRPAYQDIIDSTSMLIPWPPRR